MRLANFQVLLLCVFTSCASPPQVLDSQPTREEIIHENYQTLAYCVTHHIDGSGVARKTRVSVEAEKKLVRVYEPFGFVHNQTKFDFLFIRIKDNQTKVESYGYETLVGRDHYPNQIWPYVMECAGMENSGTKASFPGTTD